MRFVAIFLLMVTLLSLTGCTTTQKGMVIGALGGGAAGAAIGYWGMDKETDDAVAGGLIGVATGAVAGAIIGYIAGE